MSLQPILIDIAKRITDIYHRLDTHSEDIGELKFKLADLKAKLADLEELHDYTKTIRHKHPRKP